MRRVEAVFGGFVGLFALAWFGVLALFAAIAILMVRRGVRAQRAEAELRRVGLTAEAVVVDNRRHTYTSTDDSGWRRTYHRYRPQLRFRTHDGQDVTAWPSGQTMSPLALGAAVPVRYDPRNPQRLEIAAGPGASSGTGGCLAVFGVFFLVVSVVMGLFGLAFFGVFAAMGLSHF